jgi:hypothetical protein
MTLLDTQIPLETWLSVPWEEFVKNLQIIAWAISPDGSSRCIEVSQVLT